MLMIYPAGVPLCLEEDGIKKEHSFYILVKILK